MITALQTLIEKKKMFSFYIQCLQQLIPLLPTSSSVTGRARNSTDSSLGLVQYSQVSTVSHSVPVCSHTHTHTPVIVPTLCVR